ncbi:hypothetical protein ABIB38_002022 [Massilia sp. UYP11]|uniref:hypothetical protein n=1 Tax=Massilia sp. UYP11 TaxID=1756385 RepID=UPI003D2109A6
MTPRRLFVPLAALAACALLTAGAAQASGERDGLRALRIGAPDAPAIDGVLDEAVWRRAPSYGVTQLEAWNDRQVHRSLLYRYQWRVGRTVSFGVVDDKLPLVDERSRSLTFALQWEV